MEGKRLHDVTVIVTSGQFNKVWRVCSAMWHPRGCNVREEVKMRIGKTFFITSWDCLLVVSPQAMSAQNIDRQIDLSLLSVVAIPTQCQITSWCGGSWFIKRVQSIVDTPLISGLLVKLRKIWNCWMSEKFGFSILMWWLQQSSSTLMLRSCGFNEYFWFLELYLRRSWNLLNLNKWNFPPDEDYLAIRWKVHKFQNGIEI